MARGQRVIVLGFDHRFAAQDALGTVMRLEYEGKVMVRDASFMCVDDGGRAHLEETTDAIPGRAALGAAVWRLLFGTMLLVPFAEMAAGACTSTLMANLVAAGVSYRFVKELRDSVRPGRTYLALLVTKGNRDAVLADLQRFHGIAELVDSSMPDEAVAHVRQALVVAGETQARKARTPFAEDATASW